MPTLYLTTPLVSHQAPTQALTAGIQCPTPRTGRKWGSLRLTFQSLEPRLHTGGHTQHRSLGHHCSPRCVQQAPVSRDEQRRETLHTESPPQLPASATGPGPTARQPQLLHKPVLLVETQATRGYADTSQKGKSRLFS